MNTVIAQATLAWLLTYALHSTVLLAATWLAGSRRVMGVVNGSPNMSVPLKRSGSRARPMRWRIRAASLNGIGSSGVAIHGVMMAPGRCRAIALRPAIPSSSRSSPSTPSAVTPTIAFGLIVRRTMAAASSKAERW